MSGVVPEQWGRGHAGRPEEVEFRGYKKWRGRNGRNMRGNGKM